MTQTPECGWEKLRSLATQLKEHARRQESLEDGTLTRLVCDLPSLLESR